jgi:hypothetical protein
VPDPVTDQQADLADEGHPLSDTNCWERAQDGETDEPVSSSAVTPAWIAQAKLQNKWALMAQHVGQLYKANADPAVLNEAVAQAQEARINLEWDQQLDKAGLNRGELRELTDEESDHNHCWGENNAPPQPMCRSALLLNTPH